jgi:hypothetical protein
LLPAVVVVEELVHYLQPLWFLHLAHPSGAPTDRHSCGTCGSTIGDTATIVITPTTAVAIANVAAVVVITSLCHNKKIKYKLKSNQFTLKQLKLG